MKKNTYLTIDTETTLTKLCYDISGIVHDKHGNEIESFSYVIYEVYIRHKAECMASRDECGYHVKMDMYEDLLRKKKAKLVKFSTAMNNIDRLIKKYDVKAICAYNANFDKSAIENTLKLIGGRPSTIKWKCEWWDTWEMAKNTICKQKLYESFCKEHGFVTKHSTPRLKTSAETVYAYITLDKDYKEEHTGYEDCLIEVEILVKCLRQHKKMGDYKL